MCEALLLLFIIWSIKNRLDAKEKIMLTIFSKESLACMSCFRQFLAVLPNSRKKRVETTESFLDEISIFHNFHKACIWWKKEKYWAQAFRWNMMLLHWNCTNIPIAHRKDVSRQFLIPDIYREWLPKFRSQIFFGFIFFLTKNHFHFFHKRI